MKKILLLIASLIFFSFIKVFAVTCSLQVTQNNTTFQDYELETAFLSILGPIFTASKFFVLKPNDPPSKDCNVKVLTANYANFLSIRVNYGSTELFGGSSRLGYEGLQEALVLAFYEDKSLRSEICELFWKSYKLNCRLYQK